MDVRQKAKELEREIEIKKLDVQFQLQMRDKDLALLEAEAKSAMAVAEVGAAKERDVAAYAALSASQAADKASYSDRFTDVGRVGKFLLVLVDVVRGLTRPGLAWLGVLILWWLSDWLPRSTLSNAAELHAQVIEAIIYISVTASLWWFAARAPDLLGKKK